jgi:hypothetical protein
LPFETIQPALRMFVKNLLVADTNKYHDQAHVFSGDGEDLQANNAADAAILWFGPLINRDPELIQQLEAARPELQGALECFRTNRCRGGSFGRAGQMQNPRVPDPEAEARAAAVRLSRTNPDRAISKVESLPDDDKRATTELEVARGIAGPRPDEAARLIEKTQIAVGSADNQGQLSVISAQASVAAAQQQSEQLRQLLQHGFELVGPLAAQPATAGSLQTVSHIAPLVQIGAQSYPEMTIAFLQSLPPSRLKAELLLAAAAAAQMPMKLPIGSHAEPARPPGNQ